MFQNTLEACVAALNGLCLWHWLSAAYLLLMLWERSLTRARDKTAYDTKDALCSVAIGIFGVISQFTISLLIPLSVYSFFFDELRFFTIENKGISIITAFFIHDFMHYWIHRLGHRIGLLWSFHAIHHSSNAFNHTTALRLFPADGRLKIMGGVLAAFLGVSPEVFLAVALLKSVYSVWTHASYVEDLGLLENVLVTPQSHRVHHARQEAYLDKNFGQVLIIWDRLFGTHQAYQGPPIAGLVSPVHDNNPITAQFVGIAQLIEKLNSTTRWQNRVLYLLKPPSWAHDDSRLRVGPAKGPG